MKTQLSLLSFESRTMPDANGTSASIVQLAVDGISATIAVLQTQLDTTVPVASVATNAAPSTRFEGRSPRDLINLYEYFINQANSYARLVERQNEHLANLQLLSDLYVTLSNNAPTDEIQDYFFQQHLATIDRMTDARRTPPDYQARLLVAMSNAYDILFFIAQTDWSALSTMSRFPFEHRHLLPAPNPYEIRIEFDDSQFLGAWGEDI